MGQGPTSRREKKLLSRLQLASLEVSGLVSEIECEVQRIVQVQDRLKIFNPAARHQQLSSVSFSEGWRISYRAAWHGDRSGRCGQ